MAGADLTACDLREGLIAVQDPQNPFRILRHQRGPGELSYAILTGAKHTDAQMNSALAASADFRYADLRGAALNGERLCNAVLDGADLTGAELFQADLSGASMKQAVVVGVNFATVAVDPGALKETMGAPPPQVFIDEQPLSEILDGHETWRRTDGAERAPARIPAVDFRSLKQLRKRRLTALHAPGSIFFGMDL